MSSSRATSSHAQSTSIVVEARAQRSGGAAREGARACAWRSTSNVASQRTAPPSRGSSSRWSSPTAAVE